MTACIESVAVFGSELWWKGGSIQCANELQVLVNQAATGCLRTTNLGALAMESGSDSYQQQLSWRTGSGDLGYAC